MADERHDGRTNIDPEVLNDEEPNDPAVAFEALRTTVETLATDLTRDMMTIRKSVEFTLNEMERRGAPVDYSAELGRINQNQAETNEHLLGIEQAPAFKHGPEHYARVLERSGDSLVRNAAQQIERQAANLERAGRNLSAHVAGARERDRQNRWLMIVAVSGLLAGVGLTLFLPRVLPF